MSYHAPEKFNFTPEIFDQLLIHTLCLLMNLISCLHVMDRRFPIPFTIAFINEQLMKIHFEDFGYLQQSINAKRRFS